MLSPGERKGRPWASQGLPHDAAKGFVQESMPTMQKQLEPPLPESPPQELSIIMFQPPSPPSPLPPPPLSPESEQGVHALSNSPQRPLGSTMARGLLRT